MEFLYKNIFQISNVMFTFENLVKKVKQIENIQMDSKKSINSFEMKKG